MSEGLAYLGVKPCGCAVACFVDRKEHAAEMFRELAKWARKKWTVEHVPVEEVRTRLKSCRCPKKPK